MADRTQPRLTIVSGCDARYYRCEYQLLRSLRRHPRAVERVVVYDLGMAGRQRTRIERLGGPWFALEVRDFPFDEYPPLVRRLRSYAWKAPIVCTVLDQVRAPVLWLDSATIVLRDLAPVARCATATGTYVPFGGTGDVREFGHPTALAALGVSEPELDWRLRAGGVVALDGTSDRVLALARQWAELSLREECISPPGASHANHRYDQLILTILLERARIECGLELTLDELDISSAHPTPLLTSRNKTGSNVPEWLDPVLWRFFAIRRMTNAISNRLLP